MKRKLVKYSWPAPAYALAWIALLCLSAQALQADILILRNGDELEGFFISESRGSVTFMAPDGVERQYPSDSVLRMRLGFTGVPLCYTTHENPEERICNVLLHEMKSDRLIVAGGHGYTELQEIALEDLHFAELKPLGEFQKIGPLLRTSIKVRATSDRSRAATPVEGNIESIRDNTVRIVDENGKAHTLADDRIEFLVFYGPPKKEESPGFRLADLYPGVPQLRSDQNILGISMLVGFHTMLAGVLIEYQAARTAASSASSDPMLLLINNSSHTAQYERHQNNQKILGGAAGLIYLWHIFDWYYLGPPAAGPPEGDRVAGLVLENVEYRDGLYREAIYRVGLELRF